MRRSDPIPWEADFPTLYFSDEPRFSGGKDILRNQEVENHGQTSHKYR